MIEIFDFTKEVDIGIFNKIQNRSKLENKEIAKRVEDIIENVRERKDKALFEYTYMYDGINLNSETVKVKEEEIKKAYEEVKEDFLKALDKAIKNITEFHEKQKEKTWMDFKEGIVYGQVLRPLSSVGIYVPGGTASYPSSVLMNGIPAKVAGVERIVMVSPAGKKGISSYVLVAADKIGIKEIYKIGGAQAVAALAFGTESIPKVDKIVGPGNIYVAMAKRALYGYVDIDMVAGPSEILVIADESASPKYVAADLLSQAEHDVMASSILVTTSKELAEKVKKEIERQMEYLERKEIIAESLKNFGAIIVVDNLKEAIGIANEIAPEHLELVIENPFEILGEIKNAGAVFLGEFSPEPLGDYLAGPNHVLPTSGTARFFSPLSVRDFVKKMNVLYYSKEALSSVKDDVITLAEAEGLTAHANSVKVRFYND
ncbi:MAG: histidinol dehydrogenase [Caldanaerobacter sp.]|uniref:histidinol dehydrogenase n=1 Tax=Caldanaerobacter sp. TaxID=2930036 RepID=UPI0024ABC4DE|nr:histidinol dehydrogenase [Caldanaerobacter sp.]MDI3518820.1 histidinol dehydrogenase [Caldanaerobacter sp.]MDK2794117.1 histidinol dehydrogenase [Caldanaerobacter sp.]